MSAKDKIIVALDVDNLEDAGTLIGQLAPHVGCFKIGLELMTSVGAPEAVRFIHQRGGRVFLDGKFNDIPATVGKAAKAAARLGVTMFNVHASAGVEAMRAAAANKGSSLLLAVTVLTALDEGACRSIFGAAPDEAVLRFAQDAREAGVDGIICSPRDLGALGKDRRFDKLLKVTPGVRPAWASPGDQKRVMTPKEAVEMGATALVIGRPITNPPAEIGSPAEATRRILAEIA